MELNYTEVPNVLAGKDLDYLSDMFQWNYNALKKTNDFITKVSNEEVKDVLCEACSIFQSNMEDVLNILEGGTSNEQQSNL